MGYVYVFNDNKGENIIIYFVLISFNVRYIIYLSIFVVGYL